MASAYHKYPLKPKARWKPGDLVRLNPHATRVFKVVGRKWDDEALCWRYTVQAAAPYYEAGLVSA